MENRASQPQIGGSPSSEAVRAALDGFVTWLRAYGETSWDHQSFFAGSVGAGAKKLYYRSRLAGTVAVAPIILCEAFLPAARCLFHRRIRFPIADAHYAMGFAFLYRVSGRDADFGMAVHFLDELCKGRCADFAEYCWGYPFNWVTRNGVIPAQTPLITSTPYAYEAFLQVHNLRSEDRWRAVLESIARHCANDIKDFPTSGAASSCSYTPFDGGGVVNAAAYRGFLLTSAAHELGRPEYGGIGRRNIRFVLENQNPDGSWPYAVDGVRDFVDHFHTCFVMKALAKTYALTNDVEIFEALRKGISYYLENLFDSDGLPKPFAKAPRLTVYKRELYDCAECINLCLLLRLHFPELDSVLKRTVSNIIAEWIKSDGSFRSRKLQFGWDNVPMHRWGQSQMFRSLAWFLAESSARVPSPDVQGAKVAVRIGTVS